MFFLLRDKAADSLRKKTDQMTFTRFVNKYCAIDKALNREMLHTPVTRS